MSYKTYRVFIKCCVFFYILFQTLAFLCFLSVYTRVCTHTRLTPALQQNWQSSEKSPNFKEKTQYSSQLGFVHGLLLKSNMTLVNKKMETNIYIVSPKHTSHNHFVSGKSSSKSLQYLSKVLRLCRHIKG